VRRDQIDHRDVVVVRGVAHRRATVTALARIDLRASLDEQRRDAAGVVAGRDVQRPLMVLVLDLDRHSGVEEQLYDIHAIAAGGGKERLRRAEVVGMGGKGGRDGGPVQPEAGRDERLLVIQCELCHRRPVPHQQCRDLRAAGDDRVLIHAALRKARIASRRRIGVGPVLEDPSCQRDVVLLDRDPQQEAGPAAVAAHVEHRPVGNRPIGGPTGLHRVRVGSLEPPQHVAAEVGVVKDLDIERVGAALEQQRIEIVATRMGQRVLLAFSGDAGQCRVHRVAGHVIRVGVGAAIEQCGRHLERSIAEGRDRQSRVAEIEQWLPAPWSALFDGELRGGCDDLLCRLQFAADDRGVQGGGRELGVTRQEPHRRCLGVAVVAAAVDVMVPAGELQEVAHACVVGRTLGRRRCRCRRVALEGGRFQGPPVGVTTLACERVLNLAKSGIGRRRWVGQAQSLTRRRVAVPKRLQPALRFLAEIVESAHVNLPSVYARCPLMSGRKKVFTPQPAGWEVEWVGARCGWESIPLAADRRRPNARWRHSARCLRRLSTPSERGRPWQRSS
jgi:hypothetical protein